MRIAISNARTMEKISKLMKRVTIMFNENALFLSKPEGSDVGQSSIILLIRKQNDGMDDPNGLLGLRQLLNELKFHIDKAGKIDFDFELKLKEDK